MDSFASGGQEQDSSFELRISKSIPMTLKVTKISVNLCLF